MTVTSKDSLAYWTETLRQKRHAHELNLREDPESFCTMGARLRHLREQVGVSKQSMANVLGCSETTIQGYENDSSTPSWFMLRTISLVFGIPLDVLLDGVGPQRRDALPHQQNCCLPPGRPEHEVKR